MFLLTEAVFLVWLVFPYTLFPAGNELLLKLTKLRPLNTTESILIAKADKASKPVIVLRASNETTFVVHIFRGILTLQRKSLLSEGYERKIQNKIFARIQYNNYSFNKQSVFLIWSNFY